MFKQHAGCILYVYNTVKGLRESKTRLENSICVDACEYYVYVVLDNNNYWLMDLTWMHKSHHNKTICNT